MPFSDQWRPIVGAIILTLLGVATLEWIVACFWLTSIGEGDFLHLFSQPITTLKQAWTVNNFVKFQFSLFILAIPLAIWLKRRLSGESNYQAAAQYGAYGTARYAHSREIFNDQTFAKNTWNSTPEKNLQNPSGLIFGISQNKPVILPEETRIPNRNVFVVGSPGSGKTQSYILTNIIHERERSIVVTDPKGEIFEATAKLKQRQGYLVRLINFKEMTISDRYNPIDYINKEIEAEQVATTIVLNSQDSKQNSPDFWTRAEIALLKTLLLYVKLECPEEGTMSKVKEILTEHGKNPQEMDRFFSRLSPSHPAYQAYMIVRLAEKNVRASIFISLAITLSKFDPTDVRKFTAKSDFQLDELGQKKTILYCILPVADATWEALISTFFTQLFQRLYDVADKNFNRLPVQVNLLLDEFPNLGQIPGYEEILATCRSYGISASTIIQSLGQLYDKYSKEKAEAIIGNCSLRYVLGVGDKLTAEYFSDLIGKTTIQTKSTSQSNQKRGSDSTSRSYAERYLITPDELTRMPIKEAILLVSGMFGIRLHKAYQYVFFRDILNIEQQVSRFDYFTLVGRMPEPDIPLKREPVVDLSPPEPQINVPDISLDLKMAEQGIDLKDVLTKVMTTVSSEEESEQPVNQQEKSKKRKRKRSRRRSNQANKRTDQQGSKPNQN